jgi:hypothetical protein
MSGLPPGYRPPPGEPFPPPTGQYYAPPGAYPGGPPQVQKTNGLAIGALVTSIGGGILSIFCYCTLAFIPGIVAIILGRRAKAQIRASGGYETGEGLATAGEVIGWVEIGLSVLAIVGVVAIVGLIMIGNQTRNVFCNISEGLSPSP